MNILKRWINTVLENNYLTVDETLLLKRRLAIVREVAVVLAIFFATLSVWLKGTLWSVVIILPITGYVGYRIYRRSSRRCPYCSMKNLSDEDKKEVNFLEYRFSRIFRGWHVKKGFWREAPPGFVQNSEAKLCRYPMICLSCNREVVAKPPSVKSFSHRPAALKNW